MLVTRLRNQRLSETALRRPHDVVSWLGAVQAQDFTGAVWGLALRMREPTAATIERAFADGRLLRTHVLRPTWHFVTPEDIRWMQALTGPRVLALNAYHAKNLEIDGRTSARATSLMERALGGGRYLTRDELAAVLGAGRITAAGQRLAYFVMAAELEAVICSGPRRGKQFTYGLVAERAPRARVLPRDEALAELARRYFQSHGPATVHDFAWWSGLTVKDARAGAAGVPAELVLREPPALDVAPDAHYLLPNYDEYLIAYRDRGAVIDRARSRNLGIFTSREFPHHIVLGGRVAGSWRRTIGPGAAGVTLKFYGRPTATERRALAAQAARYGQVLGLPCRVEG